MDTSEYSKPVRYIAEHIARGCREPAHNLLPVELRQFVSQHCHARGLSTGTATFPPGSSLPYHMHSCGEAITVLKGEAEIAVEGRKYRMRPLDCLFVPAAMTHRVANSSNTPFLVHTAFSAEAPDRVLVPGPAEEEDRALSTPRGGEAEHLMRFDNAEMYPLAEGTRFFDLFAARFGSVGICGGYGEFQPGTSLPCHVHDFDESITIIAGEAVCQVQGRRYVLSGYDTAFVPEGRPHRFLNESNDLMAMIWVYGGSEPERTLVATDYCNGSLEWLGSADLRA
jgi:putative monooxygenase